MGDRNLLGVSVRKKNDMFFVRGSKLTSFLCPGRKLLVFSVSMEIDLVFVMVVESSLDHSVGDRT